MADTRNDEAVWRAVEARRGAYAAFSDRVWGMPELNYAEHRSAGEHRAMLEAEGFRVCGRARECRRRWWARRARVAR